MQVSSAITAEQSTKMLKLLRAKFSESFKVPSREIPRVLFHGLILSCIIAGFWLLDSLKDPVLANTVGIEYQPIAKLLSVFTTLFIVCIYDFLTSLVSKPTLFHIVSGFFGVTIMITSALLNDPVAGLENKNIGPHRLLGWFIFFVIESYGSLMVALFWSFTNSIMDLEQAKGAYGLIIALAQVGAITGSTLATNAGSVGISQLFLMSAIMVFSISLLMKCYMLTFNDYTTAASTARVRSISESSVTEPPLQSDVELTFTAGSSNNNSSRSRSNSTTTGQQQQQQEIGIIERINNTIFKIFGGFSEGLSLVINHSYILKLLGVSCLYEVIVTILDYEFKIMGSNSVQANLHSLTPESAESASDSFANLLGRFGQFTNILSFFLSFFGFSYLVSNIGVRFSLLIFPFTLFVAVILTNLVPSLHVLFVMVSIMKAMIFSLHDPVKELLYIPTSDAVKFKAKAWIDVFGARLAKAAGSTVCSFAGANARTLRITAEIPMILLAVMIVVITWLAGTHFNALIASGMVVGEEHPLTITSRTSSIDESDRSISSGSGFGRHRVYSHGSSGGERIMSSALDNQHPHQQQQQHHSPLSTHETLPMRKGLNPGDVGYDGYDLQLFEGVFESDDDDDDEAEDNEHNKYFTDKEFTAR